jgi:cation-transporting ATPase I
MDASALRLLDRIDCLVVTTEALRGDTDSGGTAAPGAEEMIAVARRLGMRVVVAGPGNRFRVDGVEGVPEVDLELAHRVRELQHAGKVVAVVAVGDDAVLAAGDCSIGLVRGAAAPPWAAHVVAGSDLSIPLFLVTAISAAHAATEQSVSLAMVGAGTGVFLAFGGLVPGTTHRATTAVNVAALMAMANGTRHALDAASRPGLSAQVTPAWHAMPIERVLEQVGSRRTGLDEADARRRAVAPSHPPPLPVAFGRAAAAELANPLTPVLAGGALLSAAAGSVTDAAMVTTVMGVNALVGATQRLRTDLAVARLGRARRELVPVVRNGVEREVPRDALVVGDVLKVAAGQVVPADCRVLSQHSLEVDESGLTGESVTVTKTAAASPAVPVAERTSMLYEGTSIAAGRGRAVVVAVAPDTEARRGLAFGGAPPETGVEQRLRHLTALSVPVALAGGAGVLAAGLLRGGRVRDSIGAATSLAVAAVPEGLPLLATVAQLGAARRLSARGALVRNPRAVEALGRVDIVCADKTGTLTAGRLALGRVSDGVAHAEPAALDGQQRVVLSIALRAGPSGAPATLPHPTDRALVEGAATAGVDRTEDVGMWEARHELPFEPARGYHAVLGDTGAGLRLSIKGAPEVVIPRCTTWQRSPSVRVELDAPARAALSATVDELASLGMRVLAVAQRDAEHDDHVGEERVDDLTFYGFVALSDPVRPTTNAAIGALRQAGVDVVMITGDHPSTALGIAREVDLLAGGSLVTGSELDDMDDGALDAVLPATTVFARVTPSHKVRIVQAYQRAGRTVAMTGDGANDAPSIRLADAGIALGKHAAPAARDAADVIVTDERIETIVDAIIEGRAMWASVRDAVAVLVGGNLGEVGFTVLGSLLGGRSPLNARQLLLVNLLTDAAPALALAMRRPPDATPERLAAEGPDRSLGRPLEAAIAWRASMTAAGALGAWAPLRLTGTRGRASTAALVALVGTQLGQTLAVGWRSPLVSAAGVGSAALLVGIVETPGVSQLFGCRPLGPVAWATAVSSATTATAAALLAPRAVSLLRGLLDRPGLTPGTAMPSVIA